jgi:lipid A 3-O-deacylase
LWPLERNFFLGIFGGILQKIPFLFLGLLFSPSAFAQSMTACSKNLTKSHPTSHGFYTFVWENDVAGGTDKNYTNGNQYSFGSLPRPLESPSGKIAQSLLGADCESIILYNLALSQSMYTPDDRSASPSPNEHPYAGWLTSEYSVSVVRSASKLIGDSPDNTPKDWSTLSLELGVVGPLALQQQVQNTFHSFIGDDHLLGWDNQIKNEPAVLLSYDRRWQQAELSNDASKLSADLFPNVGLAVGNVLTQASAGLTGRFGLNLAQSDLPMRIRPSTPGTSVFLLQNTASWYLFAGIEGRAVARNIFLDGNTFQESIRVEKKPTVTDLQWGMVLRLRGAQFSYTFITRSDEYTTQGGPQRFGSVNIMWRL